MATREKSCLVHCGSRFLYVTKKKREKKKKKKNYEDNL